MPLLICLGVTIPQAITVRQSPLAILFNYKLKNQKAKEEFCRGMHACMYACECFSFLFSKMAVVGFCTSISNDNRYNLLNFGNLFNYIYISRNYLSWYVVPQNVLRINFNQEEQRIYKTTGTTHIHIHHTQPTDAKKEKNSETPPTEEE